MAAAASVNAALAAALASGRLALAAAGAAVPLLIVAFGALVANPGVLVFAALALQFTAEVANGPIPLAGVPLMGDVEIFAADILVATAIGAWLFARLVAPGRNRQQPLRTPVMGLPLAVFGLALLVGSVRGHAAYGASFFGMPMRLALYAGIAAAVSDLTPRKAYRGVVAVVYAGTIWQAALGAYHVVTGTSATDYSQLSTGGTRYLSIAVATYLGAALLLALLNVGLEERAARRALHLCIAALAAFGVTIAFTRAIFIGLAAILPILFVSSRRLRRAFASMALPLVPALVLLALLVPLVSPQLVTTFESRLTASPISDENVIWRTRAYDVVMRGVYEQPVLGGGFGGRWTFLVHGAPAVIESDPHNGFIYLLAGGGALALGSFLLLIAAYLRHAWRRLGAARDPVERTLVIWAVASCSLFLLHAAVEPILTYPSMVLTIWVLMLLPALVQLRGEGGSNPA